MIPKYRLFDKGENEMCNVLNINFNVRYITYQTEYDDYEASFDDDSVVLMQSTGMKDGNGEDIFEGDIIEYCHEIMEVKFDVERGGWYPFAKDDGCGCCSYEVAVAEDSKVIGNIYEHAHMMKVE